MRSHFIRSHISTHTLARSLAREEQARAHASGGGFLCRTLEHSRAVIAWCPHERELNVYYSHVAHGMRGAAAERARRTIYSTIF